MSTSRKRKHRQVAQQDQVGTDHKRHLSASAPAPGSELPQPPASLHKCLAFTQDEVEEVKISAGSRASSIPVSVCRCAVTSVQQAITFAIANFGLLQIRAELLAWYDANHRVLPWRRNLHSVRKGLPEDKYCPVSEDMPQQEFAYMVWVCEIMSQQTQVSRVAEYFTRWMSKWPTVQVLLHSFKHAPSCNCWCPMLLCNCSRESHGTLNGGQ